VDAALHHNNNQKKNGNKKFVPETVIPLKLILKQGKKKKAERELDCS